MRYLSVCSGIEAASVAWEPLGFTPVGFSEIDPFPSAVLAHRFPGVQNYGDLTRFDEWPVKPGDVDLLVGGTPCQSFSLAGRRAGLADQRGNLALTYCLLLERLRPRWFVWENVRGVLSVDGGRAFGSIVGAVADLGYGFAWRVLDSRFFGVPQRRPRVFLVGCLGGWRGATAVLFEPTSLRGHLEKKRGKKNAAPRDPAPSRGVSHQPVGFYTNLGTQSGGVEIDASPTLKAGDTSNLAGVAYRTFSVPAIGQFKEDTVSGTVMATAGRGFGETTLPALVAQGVSFQDGTLTGEDETSFDLRKLTPRETERLQGFPDDWTLIPWRGKPAEECPDSLRYKAVGNSMTVNVMRWLGRRIQTVEGILAEVGDEPA